MMDSYTKNTMDNFKEFLDYCESFYSPSHPDVLYPIDGLTREELENISEISQESYKKGYIDGKKDELLKKC